MPRALTLVKGRRGGGREERKKGVLSTKYNGKERL